MAIYSNGLLTLTATDGVSEKPPDAWTYALSQVNGVGCSFLCGLCGDISSPFVECQVAYRFPDSLKPCSSYLTGYHPAFFTFQVSGRWAIALVDEYVSGPVPN